MNTKPGRIRCPHCSFVFQLPDGDLTHVNCPNCQARLRVRMRSAPAGDTGSASMATSSKDLPRAGADSDSRSSGGVRSRDQVELLPPGTRLGGYQIKSLLGRGGMAVVYLGVQTSLNRPVAIKVLNSNYASNKAFVKRFDLEAGALAALNHPNIVNIIDKGHEGLNYYFVMEHVEGQTLEQLIASTDLSFRHYAHVVGEISRALTYVHSRKVIHRDIKPSNIMVTREWQVKVGDFGIAHILEDEAEVASQPRKRATIGTAFYMAPEQATHANQVDRRADIYSLGVTFYKMFTKTLPQKPVSQWPPVSEVNNLLPIALDSVLRRAMDSYPDQRYPTVEDFCNDVLRVFRDHMEGRGASSSAILESSSAIFDRAYQREAGRIGSQPAVLLKSASVDPSTGGGLSGFDSSLMKNVPTLGISGVPASDATPTPYPLSPGSTPLPLPVPILGAGATGATATSALPGLGGAEDLNRSAESHPVSFAAPLSSAKTEPAPLPDSHQHPGVSWVVWLVLALVLGGSAYLLFLAFYQG